MGTSPPSISLFGSVDTMPALSLNFYNPAFTAGKSNAEKRQLSPAKELISQSPPDVFNLCLQLDVIIPLKPLKCLYCNLPRSCL